MDRPRYLEPSVREDLADKMIFIAGPRQVGKTTLARRIMASSETSVYLNWDNRGDRAEIRAARWPGGNALVVLDEIHKWRAWEGWAEGGGRPARGSAGFPRRGRRAARRLPPGRRFPAGQVPSLPASSLHSRR